MDTKADTSGSQKPWALWVALAMLVFGAAPVLYVLFAASSKPEQNAGLMRFAQGEMQRLIILPDPPPLSSRTLRDAAGEETNLQAFQGEVMVVNLWATWCAPCVEEMPTLAALQHRFEGRLRVIPVSVDSEGQRAEAQASLARLTGGRLPFLIDMTRGVLFDAQAPGMPVTIIYDAGGREVARLAGGADWASDETAALLEAVLAGEAS
ncbi:MAG: TlpA family protein disulfide reductase [Phycisphaerales bacterium]|nr:TlpA family protein disulfide reductase [Hyphomonadaceae bacterium]